MEPVSGVDLAQFAQHAQLGLRAETPGEQQEAAVARQGAERDDDAAQASTSLSYRRSEKTTLLIRTQEGDVVRLKFRSRESLHVDTSQLEDDETLVSEIQLRARSSTRIALVVKGELNADELAAIQTVFEQAGELADDFFAGNFAKSFEAASAFEIDGQQLAKVVVKLRVAERFSYHQQAAQPAYGLAAPAAPEPQLQAATAQADAAVGTTPSVDDGASGVGAAPAVDGAAASETTPAEDAAELPGAEQSAAAARALLLGTIVDFLSRLIETFDDAGGNDEQPGHANSSTAMLDFSLKLKIFSSVLLSATLVEENEQQSAVPDLVEETIDALVAQDQPPLEAVA